VNVTDAGKVTCQKEDSSQNSVLEEVTYRTAERNGSIGCEGHFQPGRGA
jgi:hypothetical protein